MYTHLECNEVNKKDSRTASECSDRKMFKGSDSIKNIEIKFGVGIIEIRYFIMGNLFEEQSPVDNSGDSTYSVNKNMMII
jgi:hypothetical protein